MINQLDMFYTIFQTTENNLKTKILSLEEETVSFNFSFTMWSFVGARWSRLSPDLCKNRQLNTRPAQPSHKDPNRRWLKKPKGRQKESQPLLSILTLPRLCLLYMHHYLYRHMHSQSPCLILSSTRDRIPSNHQWMKLELHYALSVEQTPTTKYTCTKKPIIISLTVTGAGQLLSVDHFNNN